MKLITMGEDNFVVEVPFDKGLMLDIKYDDEGNLFGFRYSCAPISAALGFPVDDFFMGAEVTDKDIYADGTIITGDNPKAKRLETEPGLVECTVSLSPQEKIELLAHLLVSKI